MNSKGCILVMEDNRSLVRLYESILTRKGYDVLSAYDGEEGLRRAISDKPDLIILDIIMPKVNGDEVYRHLQSNPATAKIPVLMLTRIKEQPEGLNIDANDFLSKPVAAKDMLDWVRDKIGC